MNDYMKDLRDFLFRGLSFESEANNFQTAGIQVGANPEHAEERLLSEALSVFNIQRRSNALQMLGRKAEAEESLKRCREIEPGYDLPHRNQRGEGGIERVSYRDLSLALCSIQQDQSC